MIEIQKLLRKNIRDLEPYSSARDEYSGEDAVFLDANENPYDNGVNRYPDPVQVKLKQRIGQVKNMHTENIFLGNGSDEAIDLLIRAFCEPGTDNILSMKPTYGMYKVCADINNVEIREVLLTRNYQLDRTGMLEKSDSHSKLLFLCSPNNPTSNSLDREDIMFMLENFPGIVILDEAYIDFAQQDSLLNELKNYRNLVILQTLSKAWGMAGIRLGMAFAAKDIIRILNKIKYPYNVNRLTQEHAITQLGDVLNKEKMVAEILLERERLVLKLKENSLVENILPSQANFLMVRFSKPKEIFQYLLKRKIIVRDRSGVALCEGYLRLTVGTPEENSLLLNALSIFETMKS